ncbi:MAG: polysaccharide deacetylase family protein [Armatimonadetes bacterium]|nr:polysaccharide deacetylase family protein [Armatimonadota bacterium]
MSLHNAIRRCRAATGAALAVTMLPGCHLLHHQQAAQAGPKLKHVTLASQMQPMQPIDLTKFHPNEAGEVPILEYHNLMPSAKVSDYEYPAAEFRKDMEWLYAHHYRPINLSDYVQGRIDVPAGMSPVVLTFDDALRGQFNYTSDGKIDPNCAVGILEDMRAKHPDWALKGTFFVLTDYDPKMPPPFFQKDSAQAKMEHLVQDGFEIGNHTVHHWSGMRHWQDAKVEAELAGGVAGIHKYLPTYNVQTLALPFGIFPKHRKLVIQGESGGVQYHNICALAAGYNPAPSPMAKKINFYHLPRIIPSDRKIKPGGRFTIRWWLSQMERDKTKFVSDGDPNTYTVSVVAKGDLNPARLLKNHFHLRTYSGTQLVASK